MQASSAVEPGPSPEAEARDLKRNLFSTSLISFSLTFVGVGLAVLAGYLPARQALLAGKIDAEVVLLFVPLCALVFAIVAEVLRVAASGPIRATASRRARPLSGWTPGHGEG